jgi:hypothetical protein
LEVLFVFSREYRRVSCNLFVASIDQTGCNIATHNLYVQDLVSLFLRVFQESKEMFHIDKVVHSAVPAEDDLNWAEQRLASTPEDPPPPRSLWA